MNVLSVFTIITVILLSAGIARADVEKLYSSKGYPYQLLINRVDEVKIFYHENKEELSCYVEVKRGSEKMRSTPLQVSFQAFSQMPLVSCLSRTEAKSLLAQTFIQNIF